MPLLQVVCSIDDFRKLPLEKRPNLSDKNYSFEADCQACGKFLGDGDWKRSGKFQFGVARTADGTLWNASRGPWVKSRDFFDTEEKTMPWVFRQEVATRTYVVLTAKKELCFSLEIVWGGEHVLCVLESMFLPTRKGV